MSLTTLRRGGRAAVLLASAAAAMLAPRAAHAQLARDSVTDWSPAGGAEAERYLRALQLVGRAPVTHWSIRPGTSGRLASLAPADSLHPWHGRLAARPAAGRSVRLIAPEAGGVINSRFPYGFNDGPVWAGRGLTAFASAGVEARLGRLEVTVAPMLWRAQNAGFPIAANGQAGALAYNDAIWPLEIDLPQRFGDASYGRAEMGESAVRLRLPWVAVGVSTGSEVWGPAVEGPFLLGNNAAGFPHAFLGTDGPASLGPLRLSARLIAGRLEQSAYSPAAFADRHRYLTGVVAAASLRQVPHLEVGAARLFQDVWPDSGLSFVGDILAPLVKNPFKLQRIRELGTASGNERDNQLLSVFARWTFPASGVELYGELGREDNSFDVRDLVAEPDQSLTYMFGLQRGWARTATDLLVFRAEVLNTDISHLERVRFQGPAYVHAYILQGHTNRGQLLGAASGYGGGATVLAVDRFTPAGRRSLSYRRILREPQAFTSNGFVSRRQGPRDVMHALTADWLLLRPRIDLAPDATLVYDLNRDGEGGDALNLRAGLVARLHW